MTFICHRKTFVNLLVTNKALVIVELIGWETRDLYFPVIEQKFSLHGFDENPCGVRNRRQGLVFRFPIIANVLWVMLTKVCCMEI